MPWRGERLGRSAAKRHRRVPLGEIPEIAATFCAIRRPAREGGLLRIPGNAIRMLAQRAVMEPSPTRASLCRETVTVRHVHYALKRRGCTLYGLEAGDWRRRFWPWHKSWLGKISC